MTPEQFEIQLYEKRMLLKYFYRIDTSYTNIYDNYDEVIIDIFNTAMDKCNLYSPFPI